MAEVAPEPSNTGTRPVPDPTSLTTDALRREITQLEISIEKQFAWSKELIDEKFTSVDGKLALGERQRVEQKLDTEKAIQAALTAQKEAVAAQAQSFSESVAKSEAATAKQLDQISTTFTTAINGVTALLGEVKERVITIESRGVGAVDQKVESRDANRFVFAAIGIGFTILGGVLAVIGFVT